MIENTWLFPAVEALHLIGMAWFLGPIFLGDLATLGVISAAPSQKLPRAALILVLSTGAVLFAANTGRYLANPAFLVKILVLVAALAAYFVRGARLRAATSAALWTLVILASRAVIDFDA